MVKHEKHCTKNPERDCSFCQHVTPENEMYELKEIVAEIKPKPTGSG